MEGQKGINDIRQLKVWVTILGVMLFLAVLLINYQHQENTSMRETIRNTFSSGDVVMTVKYKGISAYAGGEKVGIVIQTFDYNGCRVKFYDGTTDRISNPWLVKIGRQDLFFIGGRAVVTPDLARELNSRTPSWGVTSGEIVTITKVGEQGDLVKVIFNGKTEESSWISKEWFYPIPW